MEGNHSETGDSSINNNNNKDRLIDFFIKTKEKIFNKNNPIALFLQKQLGWRFRRIPKIEMVESNVVEYDFSTHTIHLPKHYENPDPLKARLEPPEIVLIEENAHALFAEIRPDLTQERIKISQVGINRGSLTPEEVKRIIEITLLDEGFAGYVRKWLGEIWCRNNNRPEASNLLRYREIIDYNRYKETAFYLRLTSDPESAIKEMISDLSQYSDEQIEDLQRNFVQSHLPEIPKIIDAYVAPTENILEIAKKLRDIYYRVGYFFSKY